MCDWQASLLLSNKYRKEQNQRLLHQSDVNGLRGSVMESWSQRLTGGAASASPTSPWAAVTKHPSRGVCLQALPAGGPASGVPRDLCTLQSRLWAGAA